MNVQCTYLTGVNIQYVRIIDLPPDDNLSLVLHQFGKGESAVREEFPADLGLDYMFTGVRGVHMDVEKNIPPSIDVMNRTGRMFYSGLNPTNIFAVLLSKL